VHACETERAHERESERVADKQQHTERIAAAFVVLWRGTTTTTTTMTNERRTDGPTDRRTESESTRKVPQVHNNGCTTCMGNDKKNHHINITWHLSIGWNITIHYMALLQCMMGEWPCNWVWMDMGKTANHHDMMASWIGCNITCHWLYYGLSDIIC
jgi:hypothetical protein